jgi:hypothetical protein
MLSEVMEHYGLVRDVMGQAAFFETEHARHMLRELKLAIKLGKGSIPCFLRYNTGRTC